jgi:aspartate 1-decarboxylase
MLPNEAVVVADCENGNRFETYIIPGEPGSGVIGINGAAALLSQVGHPVIILTFVQATAAEAAQHTSKVVIVDERNRVLERVEHPSTLP